MDDRLSNGAVMGLDLNQEPRELLPTYQDLIDQLESTQSRIRERIRHLGEVIERARDLRQQARSSRELLYPSFQSFVENSHASLEIMRNVGNEGGESSRVDGVDVMERNNGIEKKYKRNSNQLVARALEMDPKIKKIVKEGGGNFYDCNICLEMAKDPILTNCGHLFCWACFFKLPHQDSTSKECPVCMGEVSDNSIVPIYGNGNDSGALKTESLFKVPSRPKAQRIEGGRQLRMTHGLSVPVSEALRRIRTSIGAIGGHFWEMPRHENSNYNVGSQNAQIPQTTDGLHHLPHHPGLTVSSENSSLSDISTALTDAEGIVDEIETYIGERLWHTQNLLSDMQTRTSLSSNDPDPVTVNDAVLQTENRSLNSAITPASWTTFETLNDGASIFDIPPLQPSSSSRRRSRRLLDADRGSSHQSRRRLN
ncbi:ubiquitin-protein ligase [Lithospermum erythrorhizon]|uniref:E3 ubiquitin-protein ligase RMA n=1 Tax=Lithospermum erythrorhizon TaxID=34254 RepID=A0AAV3P5L5_LITER